MNFDLQTLAPREVYKLLSGVVVPRPIALVTSQNEAGTLNAAPYSFFNLLGANPPLVALGIGDKADGTPKDSARNIRVRGEFVVNLVTRELAPAMNICGVDFPAGVSEIEVAGLQSAPSQRVAVPRIEGTPAALECRAHTTLEIGENRIVIGEVLALYLADEFVDAAQFRVESNKLGLVARMGGAGGYTDTSGRFELARFSYEEWQKHNPRA